MKIQLHLLKDGVPKAVSGEYDPKALDVEFVDWIYLEKILLEGTVEKQEDTLNFTGHLTGRGQHTCARCLKRVEETVDYPFELFYDVKGQYEVDTLEDLREILILNYPDRYLCKEDCQGLCARCGADLNEENHATCKK